MTVTEQLGKPMTLWTGTPEIPASTSVAFWLSWQFSWLFSNPPANVAQYVH